MSGRTATATVGPTDTGRASLRTAGNDPAVRRIRIFYAQNRYHEMSRCEIIVRMARRAGSVMGALLACCGIASALNPSLDINQYAHTAWTVRDGFFKGAITQLLRRPTVISGSARNSACFASMAFGASHGSRRRASISPPTTFEAARRARWASLDWHQSRACSWKDGKLTHYPELAGQDCCLRSLRIVKERYGPAGMATPTGRLCAIQSGSVQCYGEDGSLGQRSALLV